jgi:hypothetical protein
METKETKYKVRVIRGAFIDTTKLDSFGAQIIVQTERQEWISLNYVIVNIEQIKELQKDMVRHYDDVEVPWYMDGYDVEDKNNLVVAFGADDGNGGKIFQFKKDDQKAIDEVIAYGEEKGIPKEQLDFVEAEF